MATPQGCNIAANLQRVLSEARLAAQRSSNAVPRVVAVSKTKPVEDLRVAYDAGHRDFGENYVRPVLSRTSTFERPGPARRPRQQRQDRPPAFSWTPLLSLPSVMTSVMVTLLLVGSPPPAHATAPEGIRIEPNVDQAEQYFQTVPSLDGPTDATPRKKLSRYLEGPRGKEVEKCARRCTSSCLRTGQGGPGVGPMAIRKETIVFKDSYRSASYCLGECVEVCALQIEQQSNNSNHE